MNDIEKTDQRKALDEFANAGSQPNQPSGHALVRPTSGIAERIVGAQHVAVQRDEAKIFVKLTALAAAASDAWYYRFPVKTQSGGTDWIEGASIKLANDLARIYGNNSTEVREVDVGDAWVFYSRFTDIETGFSMERAYRQRKSQTSMKTKDRDRQIDIAYQIGQSKAIRNVIVNSLQTFADFAFEAARDSLVQKIGKDVDGWRTRTLEGINRIPMELRRVERVVGRAAKDWLAPDVARVIAMMKSIADGMATADEMFPPDQEVQSAQEVAAESGTNQERNESEGAQAADQGAAESSSEKTDTAAPNQQQPEKVVRGPQLREAFEKGKADHAKGMQRKAVPLEYRSKDATDLAQNWWQGWDEAAEAASKAK
jgi:hypothetical protein